uniref:Zinc finger, AN1-type domain 1 n=1 Tax=Labrus bergylta TaxID=56723 RepID=A0A3Q3EXG9_9LABR
MAATKELVQKIVESKDGSKKKGRKGAKNSATAAKVALMKLKLHAAGDKGLPQTERTYFQVYLPKESTASSQPMFFCSKWSVGKVVDYAASLANLKNNNNVLTAKRHTARCPLTPLCGYFGHSDTVLLAHTVSTCTDKHITAMLHES